MKKGTVYVTSMNIGESVATCTLWVSNPEDRTRITIEGKNPEAKLMSWLERGGTHEIKLIG
jgi:hypothetical protein